MVASSAHLSAGMRHCDGHEKSSSNFAVIDTEGHNAHIAVNFEGKYAGATESCSGLHHCEAWQDEDDVNTNSFRLILKSNAK